MSFFVNVNNSFSICSAVLFFLYNVEQRYYQFDTKINNTFNRGENFFLLFSFS